MVLVPLLFHVTTDELAKLVPVMTSWAAGDPAASAAGESPPLVDIVGDCPTLKITGEETAAVLFCTVIRALPGVESWADVMIATKSVES